LLEAGRPLPLSTRIVKGGSDLLLAWWWLLLLSAGGLGLAVTMLLRTERGSMFWHRLQLRIPIVGELIRKQAIVRIAIVTATLLRSGIVFVKAIQIAQRSCRNKVLKDALHRCEQAVSSGRDIAVALEATGAFPPMVVQIFATGQQSGRLEEMLERLAKDYDQQVALASQRLAAVLEPLLILFLVLVVGLIAFATVLPILEAGNVL
jgi:general secretion pathway protein F